MKELDVVALKDDLLEHGLKKGTRGTIVHEYQGHSAFEVEFIARSGDTIAIATLTADQLLPVVSAKLEHTKSRAA